MMLPNMEVGFIMTGFFFFFFIVIVFATVLWQARKRQVGNAFVNAATRLGLRYSDSGTAGRQPWIYGERANIRIDVRPFHRTQDGTRKKWTGYRLQFRDPIEVKFDNQNDASRRLMTRLANRFSESEVDRDGIFCARSSLAEDSSRLVSDIEYLLNAAKELRTAMTAPESAPQLPAAEEPPAPVKVPPPLPQRDLSDSSSEAEVDLEEPTYLRLQDEEEKDQDTPPASEETSESEASFEEDDTTDEVATAGPEEIEPETFEAPKPETSVSPRAADLEQARLDRVASDLFDEGRNHFEIERHFEGNYADRIFEGSGVLQRVERLSNDRVFGRGPGLIAEIEVEELEQSTGGLHTVVALVQLSTAEESDARSLIEEWRDHLGDEVQLCGTLVKCDSFSGKLYLADGLIESLLPA